MRTEVLDPEELLAALKDGQAWAPHALVTTIAPVLMGYARLVGGGLSSTDHEAAVEAAIARGIRKIDKYDPGRGSLAGWLRPFVRHAVDDIRRTGTTSSLPDDFADTVPEGGPAEPNGNEPAREAMRRVVMSLSGADQVILHLRETEQLTYEQCAERIGGVTAGACRVRHFRALKRLAGAARNEAELAHYFGET